MWATDIQGNCRQWITLVSFLSNEEGGTLQYNETQASQMKNDAVCTSFCAIIHTYKTTGLRNMFPSVWGTAAIGYKNGLEKGGNVAAFQWHSKQNPLSLESHTLNRKVTGFFNPPPLIYDGIRWDYWSSSKWEVPPHVFWMSRLKKIFEDLNSYFP